MEGVNMIFCNFKSAYIGNTRYTVLYIQMRHRIQYEMSVQGHSHYES